MSRFHYRNNRRGRYFDRDCATGLRNDPTKLKKELGCGRAYRCAHDGPDACIAGEREFPDDPSEQGWYQPAARGVDGRIAAKRVHGCKLERSEGRADGSLPQERTAQCGKQRKFTSIPVNVSLTIEVDADYFVGIVAPGRGWHNRRQYV